MSLRQKIALIVSSVVIFQVGITLWFTRLIALQKANTIYANQATVIVLSFAFGFLSILMILWFIRWQILTRLDRMNTQVSQMSDQGKSSEEINIGGSDELSKLGSTINQTIRDLRKSQQRLANREEQFRRMVEQSTVITYTDEIDDSSSAVYMSPRLCKCLGIRSRNGLLIARSGLN